MATASVLDALDIQRVLTLVPQTVNLSGSDRTGGSPCGIGTFEEGEHRGGSSSFSTLISTLVPLLIFSVPLVFAFLYLRQRLHRVYAPRTFLGVLHDEEKTPKPAFGMFNWISEFRKLPDEFLLSHQSLDSYLFIRFFRMITVICFVGTCITWAVLIYVNGTGGGGESGLDKLAFSNVADPSRYHWHALAAWIFLGYVMYTITSETIYYINLRQAYLMTPNNAYRLSNRTILLTSVPEDYRDERWIRGEFQQVKRVWFSTDVRELERLVSERDNVAYGLEDAEIKLSTIATKKLLKGEKHHTDHESLHSGSLASQWVSKKEWPTRRVIPLVGRKIDAIEWSRSQLKQLVPKVQHVQERYREANTGLLPAVFIEFESQRAAQAAFQRDSWKQPGHMEPAAIGVGPEEVVWKNLSITKGERLARTIVANTIIVILILFWSIPVGLVGALTNIEALANSIPLLSFVNKLPSPVLGVITGLLPALLISALLALVPIICRFLAVQAGSVTLSQVELRTQGWYFAFQVVQVFLITTFSSGASSVAKQIIDDPSRAPTLLAKNLPKASNFYVSFFILQGITVAATTIFQVVPFLMFSFVGDLLDKTPRKKYNRWITMAGLSWGDTYPKFTNLAIIALAYCCIAPLVLGFAAVGFYLLYLAFRYNLFYALTTLIDTKGDAYGRAMQHLSVGVYLAELCLIGLFAAGGGSGPLQWMILLFVLTIIYHAYMNWVLAPLENTLSDDLMAEDEEDARAQASLEDGGGQSSGLTTDSGPKPSIEPAGSGLLGKLKAHRNQGGFFAPFLFHGSRSSYPALRAQLRSSFPGQHRPSLPEDVAKDGYLNPVITARTPKLWIVRDEIGISKEEIKKSEKVIEITDEGARFDEKGHIVWDQDKVREAPLWKERIEY